MQYKDGYNFYIIKRTKERNNKENHYTEFYAINHFDNII